MKIVWLGITNCLDCPHHRVITSTFTGDPYDMGDVDVVRTRVTGGHEHRGQMETVKGRAISIGDRVAKRDHCNVPDWCPLQPDPPSHEPTRT